MIEKVVVCIEVKLAERSLTDESVRQLSFEVHHQLEHFIVGLAGEHNTAGVEFIDSDSGRPQVYTVVVAHPEYWNNIIRLHYNILSHQNSTKEK